MTRDAALEVVGRSVPRSDIRDKVRGVAAYTADVPLPRALHIGMARGTRPHARLDGVDTSAAAQAAGVVATVTGRDLHEAFGERMYTGPAFNDQPMLALDRVRFVGEPIAAVAASTLSSARAAADLVTASYTELTPVLDVREAVETDTYVHELLRPSSVFRDLAHLTGKGATNVCYEYNLADDESEAALAGAAVVHDAHYTAAPVHHVPLELPFACAWKDGPRLEIVATTQTPSYVRQMAADLLGLPLHLVRVRAPRLGGSFGSKMYDRLEPLAVALCWVLEQPVRMSATREEAFLLTTRHGADIRIRMGADRDGRLLAADADVLYDTGAYADIGPRITSKSGMVATGPYDAAHHRIRSRCVYTNKPSAGPYRGFGVPQVVWAHECAIDEVARLLGEDPVAYRLRHLLREGDETPVGTPLHSADLPTCLQRVADAVGWHERPARSAAGGSGDGRFVQGWGAAVALKAVLTPTVSGASIQLNQDGSATVLISTVDMGQGSDTIMAQIAAEVLGLSAERIHVVSTDTDVTPYDTITAGSRSTYHMGNAVRLAAEDLRSKLLEMASRPLEIPPDQLTLDRSGIHPRGGTDGTRAMSVADVILTRYGARGVTVTGEHTFATEWSPYDKATGRSTKAVEHWFAGAAAAHLSVDRWTGKVTVHHLAVAGDVGCAINPKLVEQQLVGGALMGLAHALFDEMVFDQGQIVNGTMLDYQVPALGDMPETFTPIIVESAHRSGPFGAKGVGETGTIPVAPAIGNAIRDAIGVRLQHLPMTPERILSALSSSDERPAP